MSYYLRRALDGIRASPAASGVAVTSVAASVLLAGVVLLVTSNAYRMVARWASSAVDVSIYLRADATESDVVAARNALDRDDAVLESHYVSAEEAWQFLADSLQGAATLLEGIEPSVLPASLEARLDHRLGDAEIATRVATWRSLAGVSDVQASRTAPVSAAGALDVVRWVAWGLGALTLVASLALVVTTFQLAAYTRREEMDVLRLVGAVGSGYWGPVVLAGILEGVFAASCAVVLLFLFFQAVAIPIRSQVPAVGDVLAFLGVGQSITLALWGAALGGIGSAMGMKRVSEWR